MMPTFSQSLASHSIEQTKRDIETAKTKARNEKELVMLHDFTHDNVNKGLTRPQRELLQKILTRPQKAPEEAPKPSPTLQHLTDCMATLERQGASEALQADVCQLVLKHTSI